MLQVPHQQNTGMGLLAHLRAPSSPGTLGLGWQYGGVGWGGAPGRGDPGGREQAECEP